MAVRIGQGSEAAVSTRIGPWARLVGGALILAALVWRVGVGPFLTGLSLTSAPAVAAALVLTALTTLCCAWRWTLVASGLGMPLGLGTAVGAYYRSQFLNAVLPGGVLGDVHRGIRSGRARDDVGAGLRSVAWERASGQTVQVVVILLVLLAFGVQVVPADTALVCALGVTVGVVLVVGFQRVRRGRSRRPEAAVGHGSDCEHGWRGGLTRIARQAKADLGDGVLASRVWPGIVTSSTLALLGYVALFLIAMESTGTHVPAGRVVPVALVVLLAAAIPMNIAGWGPREGAAAWAFAAGGLGAAQGVTVAVVYGVLVLVAALPGAVLLLADRFASSPRRAGGSPARQLADPVRAIAR